MAIESKITIGAARKLARQHVKEGRSVAQSAKLLRKAGYVSQRTGEEVSTATVMRLRLGAAAKPPRKLKKAPARAAATRAKSAKKKVGRPRKAKIGRPKKKVAAKRRK